MKVTLTRFTQNPIVAIEEAASNCYNSKPTSDGRIMKSCYKSGHQSVLEFADFTFHIEDVSRALLAQITRHRMASFAVRSQRYVSELGFKYVRPKSIADNPETDKIYKETMDIINNAYSELQALGIKNEDARMVLPNACTTVLEVKMNGRELIHFMNERLCAKAQWEIRELALKMRQCILENEECSVFAEFLVPKCKSGQIHYCPEHKSCGQCPTAKQLITKGGLSQ